MNPVTKRLRLFQCNKIYLRVLNSNYIKKNSKSTSNDNSTSSSSSSSNSSDNDTSTKTSKKEEKMKKLNELLMQLVQQEKEPQGLKIDLAHPPNRRIKKEKEVERTESEGMVDMGEKISKSVKMVAEEIGGDTKTVESELLMKLLNPEETSAPKNLTDIIKDMKIDREKTFLEQSRAEQVRSILQTAGKKIESDEMKPRRKRISSLPLPKHEKMIQKIDLFGGESLGIFTNANELKENIQTKTWSHLYNRDLKLAVTHPPANYFQQMILWTEQGKIWKFPIDNEQGLDEEKKVHFSQHVLLEEHLDPWCPHKGPIRHFMELVCVGLSKNSYLTVQAKKDHIEWYKNYFENKQALLKEVDALQDH